MPDAEVEAESAATIATPKVSAVMCSVTIAAASRSANSGDANSSARIDSVIVSRDASRITLAVAPAALTKFSVPRRIMVGINSGSQMRT